MKAGYIMGGSTWRSGASEIEIPSRWMWMSSSRIINLTRALDQSDKQTPDRAPVVGRRVRCQPFQQPSPPPRPRVRTRSQRRTTGACGRPRSHRRPRRRHRRSNRCHRRRRSDRIRSDCESVCQRIRRWNLPAQTGRAAPPYPTWLHRRSQGFRERKCM